MNALTQSIREAGRRAAPDKLNDTDCDRISLAVVIAHEAEKAKERCVVSVSRAAGYRSVYRFKCDGVERVSGSDAEFLHDHGPYHQHCGKLIELKESRP